MNSSRYYEFFSKHANSFFGSMIAWFITMDVDKMLIPTRTVSTMTFLKPLQTFKWRIIVSSRSILIFKEHGNCLIMPRFIFTKSGLIFEKPCKTPLIPQLIFPYECCFCHWFNSIEAKYFGWHWKKQFNHPKQYWNDFNTGNITKFNTFARLKKLRFNAWYGSRSSLHCNHEKSD